MALTQKQLRHCVELATELADMYADQYPGMSVEPVRDTDSLLWLCSVRSGKWIRTREPDDAELAMAEMAIWGMMAVLDDGYEIVTVPGLDEKLRRFVLAKE